MIITGFRGTSPTQKQVIELKQKIDEKIVSSYLNETLLINSSWLNLFSS